MRIQLGSNLKQHSGAGGAAREPKSPAEDTIGILSFEVAGAMSKAVQLHRSLSPSEVSRLCNEVVKSHAVRHLVSEDEVRLLKLVAVEKLEQLSRVAAVVSRLGKRCSEPAMAGFEHVYADLVSGRVDPAELGVLPAKEMDAAVRKMERYVASTASLYAELELLGDLEHGARKLQLGQKQEQKIQSRRHELKHLREASLWNQTNKKIVSLMASAVCTIYARIRLVFGFPAAHRRRVSGDPPPARKPAGAIIPCGSTPARLFGECLSFTAAPASWNEEEEDEDEDEENEEESRRRRGGGGGGAAGSRAAALAAPSTVGGSALALHYANVIIIIEKLLRYPHLVGEEARDDLYQMLPSSLRAALRIKLRSYAKELAIYDAPVAFDWKGKLETTLTWLSPMAHNMVTWQTERNFEQSQLVSKVNVLLLQTLFFADREKTEAAICELLVGLNYICRYEHQRSALLRCAGSFDFDHTVDFDL